MTVDADNTRRLILDAACELILENGPAGLSARAVARRAGVSPALIHHHFVDRDGLIDVVIDTLYSQLHDIGFELVAQLGQGRPLAELLAEAVRKLFRLGRDRQPLTRLILMTVDQRGELDVARFEQTQQPLLRAAGVGLAKRLGLSELEVRMRLRSLVLLVSRYAAFSDEAVRRQVGADTAQPWAAIEDHLVGVALLLLAPR